MPPHASVVTQNFNFAAAAPQQRPSSPPSPPLPTPAKRPKQGICSILGSESATAPSIRRTLSADVSSKKWLSYNGFSASPNTNKIPSSLEQDRRSFSASDIINRPGQDEVWRAIQAHKLLQNDHHHIKPALLTSSSDSFSSILSSQKTENSSKLPPPYVHPLEKKSAKRRMSEKSLQICTENLGSETGADDYSPDLPLQSWHLEAEKPLKNRYSKTPTPRAFPPPLPSLDKNANSVQVLPRRQNGRLILQAVSVPPQEYLQAERQDGRLLIAIVNGSSHQETEYPREDTEMVFNSLEEIGNPVTPQISDDCDEAEEVPVEQYSNMPKRSQPLTIQLPGLNSKKNTIWSNNKALVVEKPPQEFIINQLQTHSLPPAPGVAGLIREPPAPTSATFVNAYDYFWRRKPTVAGGMETEQCKGTAEYHQIKKKNTHNNNDGLLAEKTKDSVVLLRGTNANNMIPMLNLSGCKDVRRSLLLRDPYCIATT